MYAIFGRETDKIIATFDSLLDAMACVGDSEHYCIFKVTSDLGMVGSCLSRHNE